jgi:hypothetical protein
MRRPVISSVLAARALRPHGARAFYGCSTSSGNVFAAAPESTGGCGFLGTSDVFQLTRFNRFTVSLYR